MGPLGDYSFFLDGNSGECHELANWVLGFGEGSEFGEPGGGGGRGGAEA